jgi:crotonobetainyl-CoA:carnitine CoA-transferase CaiB-like acyl-CoA transferase
MTAGPLDGVKVLDLSRLFPGPYATLLLADLGADVVRVEDTRGGDMIRYLPPHAEDGQGVRHHALNRGKRSVALNLRNMTHAQVLEQLATTADVLVESFRPGVLERLGFTPERLHELNPRLIICRISGFGQDGPDAHRAGHDLNYAARAGVLGMMKRPAPLPVQIADVTGGSWPAAFQITAALFAREQTGKGAVIDVSMTEGARAMLVMAAADHAGNGESVGAGRDMLCGSVPCYDVYETKDGFISVGALEPKFWAGLVGALELEEIADAGLARGEEGEAARATLQAKLHEKTTAEWEDFFRDHDVCVEPVRSPEEAATGDAQLAARGVEVAVKIGDGELSLPKTPLSLAQAATAPAPNLGADTSDVLHGWGVDHALIESATSEDG